MAMRDLEQGGITLMAIELLRREVGTLDRINGHEQPMAVDVPPGWGWPPGFKEYAIWWTVSGNSATAALASTAQIVKDAADGLRALIVKWAKDEIKKGRYICKAPKLTIRRTTNPMSPTAEVRFLASVYSYDKPLTEFGIEEVPQ